ncbi:conserved hypothetical protein [Listeria seeligeri FSL N1-067]|uniref:Uncharacterized protein n=1 Tax=Listeria seeligeri FSL N1-067 TaxID=702453 RepID=E3ZLU9_LISSE|nr:conserved hypothetical protein [Listeria seeligeri FSL N1-067]
MFTVFSCLQAENQGKNSMDDTERRRGNGATKKAANFKRYDQH